MSGDVQPRKRKDKKRKKDDLGVEEPRGTAAALGDGDLFIHSHHEHGTGGHWCAKIIFFSLLAILITLIGLIILENRGLSELEANSVESRYSGVLEGWLEDAPDDDHHDVHTLELKHHDHDDEEEEQNGSEADDDEDLGQDEDNSEEIDHDEDNSEEIDHEDDEDDTSQQIEEDNEDEVDEQIYSKKYYSNEDAQNYNQDDNENDEDKENNEDNESEEDTKGDNESEEETKDDYENEQDNMDSYRNYRDDDDEEFILGDNVKDNYKNNEVLNDGDEQDDDDGDNENDNVEQNESDEQENLNEDEDEHDEHGDDEDEDDDHASEEVEKIEHEVSDEDPISTELPALPEEDDDSDDNSDNDKNDDGDDQSDNEANQSEGDVGSDDNDDEFLEQIDDDDDGPPVEKITAPSGQPFDEIEEFSSKEKPPNTLDDEEEYEKQQEELRREEEEKSSQNDSEENEEETPEEESPSVIDRRMTLLLHEPPVQEISKKSSLESSKPIPFDMSKKTPLITKSAPTPAVSLENEEEEQPKEKDKELYSDEEIEEEEEEEEIIIPTKIAPKQALAPQKETPKPPPKVEPEPEPEEEEDDEDVEIIDEEQLEEEEVEDEEEISDVDDVELLSRLEAKYGRLPEPERPGARHKDGGNSMEDYWPSEPSDPHWHEKLEEAERDLLQGRLEAALTTAKAAELQASARARWVIAQALDKMAEAKRDNKLLTQAIAAYLEVLKMNQNMSDKKLLQVTERALNRIQFRGTYLSAEPVYRLLIRRFPNDVRYRNNLTITFLMAGRSDLAEGVLKETLKIWPNERVALAHYAFVLKTEHNRYEEAVGLFQKALKGDVGPACEPRFYYHYGDALLLLGRFAEAHEVHKRGAAHGHFLSPEQRSLYNVERLKSRPWWDVEKQTPYANLARALERSWRDILKEGEAAKSLYEQEKEGLRERGEWSQLDLFVRGQEIPGRCKTAPVTCSIVRSEAAAIGCRRGQIKFSSMEAGTHVRPHVGPTNCRLRMHLGLKNTKDTYIRVHKETRQWREGKVLLFDDSFEHEVWHNGTGTRLVLIVDVWHPDLTAAERRRLPAI